MPYSGPGDENLPDYIKEKSKEVKDAWVKAWNNAHASCQEKSGKDCEGYAFRVANAAIKEMSMEQTNILFVELEQADGKPFDGLVAGEFEDMFARKVVIKPDDITALYENTVAALESTKTEGGELVGLPIDAKGHDKGDAAGWIKGVELVGGILRIIPEWTKIGVDLIGNKIRRLFSATVDLTNKVILGGTLTNWPAVRAKNGKLLLRPIELSHELQALGLEVEIKAASGGGEKHMTDIKYDELPEDKRAELEAQARDKVLLELAPPVNADETREQRIERLRKELNLEAFAGLTDLEGVQAALTAQLDEVLMGFAKDLEAQSGRKMAQMMASMKRGREIAEFSQRMVNGNDEFPRGLPVDQVELEEFMKSLNDIQRHQAEKFFGAVVERGLIDFSEKGHNKRLQGTKQLDGAFAVMLKAHIKAGGSAESWFAAAGEDIVGAMDQYDLSAFMEAK